MSLSKDIRNAAEKAMPLIEAKRLAQENDSHHKRLEAQRNKTQKQFEIAHQDLNSAFRRAFDDFLAPFADHFARLKNVDLDDLPILDAVPELACVDVKMQKVAVNAVKGLTSLAGGSAAGATAGAMTFTAVSTFAAASTGTAISGLSGAAATSATLAWLGGGSLAAGGGGVAAGTAVLTGLVAAPVLLAAGGFLYWQGKKTLEEQKQLRQKLKQADVKLSRDCDRVAGSVTRYRDTRRVTHDLVEIGLTKLPIFASMLEANDDFAAYSVEDRAKVAELAGLAQVVAAVLACPIVDEKGNVTPLAEETLKAAQAVVVGHAA